MKRQIVYYGALPQDTDLLNVSKNAYVGLAKLAAAILGTNTIFHSLAATPGSGLNVVIGPGQVYSLQNLDNAAFGSLAADTSHQILKQGVNLDNTTLSVPAPGTAGQSINYLIQGQFQEVDGGAQVLPYYNSANPQVALSGQNNNGQAQSTYRDNIVALQVKAGTAATTGSQATPAADSGWTGLYVVTVAYGATSVSQSNIATVAGAPFLTNNLYNFANGLKVGGRVQVNGAADDGSTALAVAGGASFTNYVLTKMGTARMVLQSTTNGANAGIYANVLNGSGAQYSSGVYFYPNAIGLSPDNNNIALFSYAGGRVSIGQNPTDNGTDALQVAGTIQAKGATGNLMVANFQNEDAVSVQIGATTGAAAASDVGLVQAYNRSGAGTGLVLQPNGGRVLVGTSTDNGTDALQVAGTARVSQASSGAMFSVSDTGTPNSTDAAIFLRWMGTYGEAQSYKNGTGPLPLVFQRLGGRVLIGTATDNGTDALQVNGSVGINQATNALNLRSHGAYINFVVGTSSNAFIGGSNNLIAGGEDNSLGIRSDAAIIFAKAGGIEAMRMSAGGRFLIGTTTDNGSDTLQVAGSINAQVVSSSAQIKFGRTGTSVGSGAFGADSTYIFRLYKGDLSASGLFNVTQTGRVLIGTDTDNGTDKLQVLGTAAATDGFVFRRNMTDLTGRRNWQITSEYNVTGDLAFLVSSTNTGNPAATVMDLLSSGRVLINTGTDNGVDTLQVNGTINASAGTSGNQLVNFSQFANSKATSGYQKLPNGLILQWATGVSQAGVDDATQAINFPVAFPNACLQVIPSLTGATANTDGFVQISATSLTSATVFYQLVSGAATGNWTPAIFAIGY